MAPKLKTPKVKPRQRHMSAVQQRNHNRRVVVWMAENRGKVQEIADSLGRTSQFISMVLKGRRRSSDGMVEIRLRAAGAPVPNKNVVAAA